MRYLSIKNLDRYQHYKERRPVWVKLYQSVLEDIAFTCLQDASKAHALLLLLIASRYDNRIPWDAAWVGRAVHATDPVDLDALIASGFLVDAEQLTAPAESEQDASTSLARRKQVATPKRTENREVNNNKAKRGAVVYSLEFEQFWNAYPSDSRGTKKAAADQWAKRLKAGYTADIIRAGAERYIAFCIAKNRYVKNASTFLGPDLHFLEPWELPADAARPSSASSGSARQLLATEQIIDVAVGQ